MVTMFRGRDCAKRVQPVSRSPSVTLEMPAEQRAPKVRADYDPSSGQQVVGVQPEVRFCDLNRHQYVGTFQDT